MSRKRDKNKVIFVFCPRCGNKVVALVSSLFSKEKICIDCKRTEMMSFKNGKGV